MKKEELRKPPKCVQCHGEMLNGYGNKTVEFPFCAKPECPNFSLLATGILPKDVAVSKKPKK